MNAPRVDNLRPYGWCAVLAAANDDVLGTALAQVADRHRPRHPELVEVLHYRHRAAAETSGTPWFLFVAAVMTGEPSGDLADTHAALARDLWAVCLLWTHTVPTLRRFAPGAPQPARYHRPAARLDVLPPPPPERPRPVPVAPAKAVERVAPEAPKPPAAPPAQKGLFG